MFVQITALGPKLALIRGSIVLHRLIKGNVKNLQVSDLLCYALVCVLSNFAIILTRMRKLVALL